MISFVRVDRSIAQNGAVFPILKSSVFTDPSRNVDGESIFFVDNGPRFNTINE
jgi:hypothetical protein